MNSWIPVLATVIIGIGPAFFAYKQAVRVAAASQKAEALRVDGEAYERAKKIYESGLNLLEEQLKQLRAELESERDVKVNLRKRVAVLEEIVAKLRRQMILAGIDPGLGPGGDEFADTVERG